MSNHTQILARRVLYWPSYIVDQNNDNFSEDKGRLKKNVDYPALVSLGRTSIWKEHSKNDDEEDNKVESARVVLDKEDIEEEVDYQHEKSCGNNNSILGNICGPLFGNEDDAEESSGDNEQYHLEKGKSQGKQQFDSSTGLRDEERCPAPFDEFGLLCKDCRLCTIQDLQAEAERLGYAVLTAEGSADSFSAEVDLVEPMGAETLIHMIESGRDIRVVVPREQRVAIGERVHLRCKASQCHVFDGTQRRMVP